MKTKRLTAVAILACVLASASLVDAQSLQTLCSFNSTNGAEPYAALTMGNDGNFYGTTSQGGSYTIGTVFKMTTNGTLTTLASFAQTNGASPYAALTMGNDGNFYAFAQTNGASPYAGLTMGNDGNFYGTTARGGSGVEGGSGGYGTVFKVTTKGTLTTLVSFKGTNGAWPYAGLTMGNDGNFYGTTYVGGSIYDDGTVFKMTTNGTLTTLASFAQTNGASPYAALTMGNDGNFYAVMVWERFSK
ncbi:MAG: choice-of-anchor tandem repeat GloVer-containing protein [Verrucomicrobiota bacterium]